MHRANGRGGREQGGCPHFFFFVNLTAALHYLTAWNRLKILPLVKLFSDPRAPFVNAVEFSFLNLSNVTFRGPKNYSVVTNRSLQARKL